MDYPMCCINSNQQKVYNNVTVMNSGVTVHVTLQQPTKSETKTTKKARGQKINANYIPSDTNERHSVTLCNYETVTTTVVT
jgi:DNA primase